MTKIITRSIIALFLIVSCGIWILFLNIYAGFLPDEITFAVDDFCYNLFGKEGIESVDTSDYVWLSTLSDSSLLKSIDLFVPNDTYIPTKAEIDKTYSGLFADSVVAALPNYDIIVQNYGVETTADLTLTDFREHVVSDLEKIYPEIHFDTSNVIKKGDKEIPVIEFSTSHEDRVTYSFVALVDVNGKLVTVSVNSADYYFDAGQFFSELISNLVV